jgi:3-oxoacyl-[acyl-carrier-protein] synthase-1
MRLANADGRKIDYLNPHGTSTPVGDVKEMDAGAQRVRRQRPPGYTHQVVLTVHSLGAAGAQESIYSLLMLGTRLCRRERHTSRTSTPPSPTCRFVRQRRTKPQPWTPVMSNSFGFAAPRLPGDGEADPGTWGCFRGLSRQKANP